MGVGFMKRIVINDVEYDLIKDYKNVFNQEELLEKITDYFDNFDYILGDYSYDRLRLKGFCNKDNKGLKEINDFDYIEQYINDYCSYNCGYYILEKVAKKRN